MTPVYCPLCCDQPFEDQQALFFHLRGLRNNLFCSICSEKFSTLEILISHLSRKCYGPISPSAAKRRRLPNDRLKDTSITEVVKLDDKTGGKFTHETRPSSSNLNPDSGVSTVADNTNDTLPLIPPELKNKFSKMCQNVTLSVGPITKSANPLEPTHSAATTIIMPHSSNDSCNNIPMKNNALNKTKNTSSSKSRVNLKNPSSGRQNVPVSVSCIETSTNDLLDKTTTPLTSKSVLEVDPLYVSDESNKSKTSPVSKQLKSPYLAERISSDQALQSTNIPSSPNSTKNPNETIKTLYSGFRSKFKTGDFTDKVMKQSNLSKAGMKQVELSNSTPETNQRSNLKVQNNKETTSNMKERKRKRGRPSKFSVNTGYSTPMVNGVVKTSKTILPDFPIESSSSDEETRHSSIKTCSRTVPNTSECDTNDTTVKEICKKDLLTSKEQTDVTDEDSHDYEETGQDLNNSDYQPGEDIDSGTDISIKVNMEELEEYQDTSVGKLMESKEEVESLFGDGSVDQIQPKTEIIDEEYTCSTCDIKFISIYEHIKDYHNGEEVVVEVPEDEIKDDLKAYQDISETKVSIGPVRDSSGLIVGDSGKSVNINSESIVTIESVPSPVVNGIVDSSQNENGLRNSSKKCLFSKSENKVKKKTRGKWIRWSCGKNNYYQFVNDQEKHKKLMAEVKSNKKIHPKFKLPISGLFENPKVNVIEITNKPNAPFFVHRMLDLTNPIPMYVMERQNVEAGLGGIASYIIADPDGTSKSCVPKDSKVIGVMKVILGSDKKLTVENVVFRDKPVNENMIPVLEETLEPDIPLLTYAKVLLWKCVKCLATTWKFPLATDTHICNACIICHKPFVTNVSLRNHIAFHREDKTKYCKECHSELATKDIFNNHMELHSTHVKCSMCKLFVSKNQKEEHFKVHMNSPDEQFSCSACKKEFSSVGKVKTYKPDLCAGLVAKYNCSSCYKKFFTVSALFLHTKQHKKKTSLKYPCKFCNKVFIIEKEQSLGKAGNRIPPANIQRLWHEKIHLRDRPIMCSACPKRFRSVLHQSLHTKKVHQPSVHRDVPIHMCAVCDKAFNNSQQLTMHYKLHSNSSQME